MSIETTLPASTLRKISVQFGKDAIDLGRILPLARQLHKESMFSDMPFDQPQLEKVISDLKAETGFHGSVYIEFEGEPVAFAYLYFSPLMGSRQTWVTIMHTVYVRSDIRSTEIGSYVWQRIMLAVRGWSAPRGSKGIMFNVVSGIAMEETDLVLRSNGATHLGGNYFMRL